MCDVRPGLANPHGPAASCWQLVVEKRVRLFVSDAITAEVAAVLRRPKLRDRFGFTEEIIRTFLDDLSRLGTFVPGVPAHFSHPRDPKDEAYVNLALHAGARYVVTWDNDLLDLMDASTEAGREFRSRHPGVVILNPPAFLAEVRATTGPTESEGHADSAQS